jgi:hypothetical protein
MAFVPGYEHDIFVSYARTDDFSIVEGPGWVSNFVKHLQDFLAMRLGRAETYSIWMDQHIIGNEPFSGALLHHINQSAALIIILSPDYLASEWCSQETNAFLEAIRNRPHAGRRVFVIENWPTKRDDWPVELRSLIGYKFWGESHDNRPRPLGYPSPYLSDKAYFERLSDLVFDLVGLMKALRESQPEPDQYVPEPGDSVALDLTPDDVVWFEEKRERGEYDVFLCHNDEDKPEVKKIGELLIRNRIVPWLDEWELRPGLPWQVALEAQIGQMQSAAVLMGETGFGPWQNMELAAFLREFATRRCPVIPVVLST